MDTTGTIGGGSGPVDDPGSPSEPDRPFGSSWRRRRLSVEERVARGREARRVAPRSTHAGFTPAPDRPDPVGVLEAQAADRVPDLLPLRYGRMLESPFTFFRGAAALSWHWTWPPRPAPG